MSPNDIYHTCAQETIRTRGSTSNLFATLSDPTRSAPAPSQTPDELPVMCVPSFSSGKKFPKTSSRNWPTVANIFIYVLAVIPFVMELQIDQFKALTTQIRDNTCTKVILPAVTTPSTSNTGFRLASCSAVESGRGCSSASIVLDRMPSITYTVSNSKQAAVLVT